MQYIFDIPGKTNKTKTYLENENTYAAKLLRKKLFSELKLTKYKLILIVCKSYLLYKDMIIGIL